jgi:hypothetical protein
VKSPLTIAEMRRKGGNRMLCILHDLDNLRKHVRLLDVGVSPRSFIVSAWGEAINAFVPVSAGYVRTGPDETTIGMISKSATEQPNIKLTPQVSFSEAAHLPRREVITALRQFASLANSIIELFDY